MSKLIQFISSKFRTKHIKKHKDNLNFCFKDLEGLSYYKWNDELSMPVSRLGEMMRMTMELSAGLDGMELEKLLKLMDDAIVDAIKDPKKWTKLAGYIHEIRLRKTQISNTNLYYNMFAVNYIREDENPLLFNKDIQVEKVKAFKKGALVEDSFFFALPELKTLCKQLNILTINWKDIEGLSDMVNRRNEQAINTIMKL